MIKYNTIGYTEDIYVSEANKNKKDYLQTNMDHYIALLVREKKHIRKLRDYYAGVRDNEDFLYLTDNFGLGSPTDMQFTPLIKPRIDALLGNLLAENVTYRVTCTDDKSIDLGMQERKQKYLGEIKQSIENFIQTVAKSVQSDKEAVSPAALGTTLNKVKRRYLSNYTSDLEIAAQDLLNYFQKSATMGLKQKFKQLILDLLITGECYYRVYYSREGADPILEVIKPENIFFVKNTNYQTIKESGTEAVVHREYLTRKEILKKYGKYMDKEQLEILFGDNTSSQTYTRYRHAEDDNHYSYNPYKTQINGSATDAMEVLHIEWIGLNEVDIDDPSLETITDKGYYTEISGKTYRMDRYEGTKIGEIYVNCGKVSEVPRSMNDPYACNLSYNGIAYNDRAGTPYSMVSAMIDVQDLYDIVLFYRNAMIASAGGRGSRINTAAIPEELGEDFMERLLKFVAIKKNGLELVNPTLEGAAQFQHYGEYDNSLSQTAIGAIDAVLASITQQADLICGVNQPMLGQIAQRDAVTNIQQGIHQTLMMNEDLFELSRQNCLNVMIDLLDVSKLTYRKGKKVSYILGSEAFVFNIMPDMMSFSDFAISPSYSSKDELKLKNLQSLVQEYAKGGMVDPDIIVKVALSESISEVKELIEDAMAEKKQENDQLAQAQQQLQQMEEQVNQLKNENNQMKQKLDQIDEEDRKQAQLKQQADIEESKQRMELEKQRADDLAHYQNEQIRLKEKLLQAELVEAKTGTGNEREIKNV